jgi:3-isopropylmalate/(R)-2-methylmalate dehydratase small subunit
MKRIKGRVWKFGDNVDTDQIIEAKTIHEPNPEKYLMRRTDNREFLEYYQGARSIEGHIFVAGDNFGCGSSRENAVTLMKKAGIATVVAKSFARIYHRNGIAVGFPLIECDDVDKISQGDIIEIYFENGEIYNHTTKEKYRINPLPPFIQKIVDCGGIIPYRIKQLSKE